MSGLAPLQFVQGILHQQKDVGRPPQEVCFRISGLKDLVELGGSGFQDWRRGPAAGRIPFRTGGGGQSPQTPSSPLTPISANFRRNNSYNSNASVDSNPSLPSLGPGSPATRYQSKFKNSNQPVESKILNNIILSKLNKFSPATYSDIRDFLYQILGSGESDVSEMIRDFMMLVFRKAASEEIYCSLYAKLLAEISDRYKVILEEMHKLQANYLEVFDDVVEIPEGGDGYEEFVAKNREKRYRQGYSQFLAELSSLEILNLLALEQSVEKLVSCIQLSGADAEKRTLVEEYVDCLVRMLRVFRKKRTPFAEAARTALQAKVGARIQQTIDDKAAYPSITPKSRFILMDVKDILDGK